ncbi:hypothetical protein B296_00037211 [Ensete ventricosum]|uniref:Retrotransposon gag domain-containing protein n=1 Tax=Ensete ventricosum TaxID=4639 RepID=A0A426YVG2_ENSVE|nr:hypothetical protein B296_00037211 [Ensete ventricosum]
MSQDRISNLFPSRVTKEAIPPTPIAVTMPQITTAPSAPHPRLADGGQSTLTPDRYWRLFTDPGLTPLGLTAPQSSCRGGLPRAGPSSTGLDEDDTGYHPPYSLACLDNDPSPTGAPVAPYQPRGVLGALSLTKELEQNFLANARPKPTVASLLGIAQGRDEPLAQFVNRFATETQAIPDAHPSLIIQAFLMGIRPSKLFWSLVKKPPTTVPEMMQRANHFITAEILIVGKREEQKRP